MILSPRTLTAGSVTLTLAVCTLVIALALNVPVTGTRLAVLPERVDALGVGASTTKGLAAGDVVTAFVAGNERIPAAPVLLVEDPDAIETFADYNTFMAQQRWLAQSLAQGVLKVEHEDGRQVALLARERTFADLPAMFWLQLLFGVGGMLTGALVMAGRPADNATRLYALTGLGFLVFAPAAAVYSTRELILDGDIFRLLSLANHFGALLFTASLTALLWTYPVRLRGVPMVAVCYVAAAAAWACDIAQVGDSNTLSPITVLAIFLMSFVFAGMQWFKTRKSPAERAALRWFLLSIYLATGLFAGVILVPNAIGVPPPASQGVMFGAFLIMYWGLALGVVRYRLFDLAQWWRAIWWWFLGGLSVVVVDVLLVSTLALSEAVALTLAVAIVGWIYFPLRQWIWSRFGVQRDRNLGEWLPDVLPLLMESRTGSSSEEAIRGCWPHALDAVFRPLATEAVTGNLAEAGIREDGLALAVPDMHGGDSFFLLRHAAQGDRLFTRRDIATIASLRELFELSIDSLRARDAGARVERERIRRDIHDDLGAKLLTLLHTTPEECQPLVREALDDLRSLVRALEQGEVRLCDAVDGWQAEARRRCSDASVALQWQSPDIPELLSLGARAHANLTRVLREAVSNALRHAQPSTLRIGVGLTSTMLSLEVANNGKILSLPEWSTGRGRQIMQGRISELGGSVRWQVDEGECRLLVAIPLAEAIRDGDSPAR
ncbi:MAG: sensor histidine kinase [Gammaproteobacteria bacterium]